MNCCNITTTNHYNNNKEFISQECLLDNGQSAVRT